MVPGISQSRAILPAPIAPTFTLLDGAYFPKTEAGTIVGAPANIAAPAVPFKVFLIKFLLEDVVFFELMV
jgi:hypothetical protein